MTKRIPTEKLIQEALDHDWCELREDLPGMEQDGTIEDEEYLRGWLLDRLDYPQDPIPGGNE